MTEQKQLWFQCPCGYETPVDTGMMMHLSMYRGKIHRYKQAVWKTITQESQS